MMGSCRGVWLFWPLLCAVFWWSGAGADGNTLWGGSTTDVSIASLDTAGTATQTDTVAFSTSVRSDRIIFYVSATVGDGYVTFRAIKKGRLLHIGSDSLSCAIVTGVGQLQQAYYVTDSIQVVTTTTDSLSNVLIEHRKVSND